MGRYSDGRKILMLIFLGWVGMEREVCVWCGRETRVVGFTAAGILELFGWCV